MIFTLLGVPLLYYSYLSNVENTKIAPKGFEYPTHPHDLIWAPIYGVVLYFIQVWVEKTMTPFFYEICKVKDNEGMRRERAAKSANRFWKCAYYTIAVFFEVYMFSGLPWWPK